ncbi:hypothetical protein BD410DRAFT_808356 [Rickenella mellea]|uniref:Uncharacterized protein n=1 Tax=Rickenella mellea TaxID=50990 RepID=A0A4Y7PKU2_9AGAM|nr:hypothetical protein BD410DRAFT_808356 [Rickenella mellea]
MARPRRHKTEKEQINAARKRRREWYHRNRRKESAKALERYYHNKTISHQPQTQPRRARSSSPHVDAPAHASATAFANSPLISLRIVRLNTQERLTSAQKAMHTWRNGETNVRHKISNMQHVIELWTSGSLRAWGNALYLNVQHDTDAALAESKLEPHVTFGQRLQDCFEEVSRRSFQDDPSGSSGIWGAAQLVSREIARAVDIVEEFCLILRDGGITSLQNSFAEQSLNFQII